MTIIALTATLILTVYIFIQLHRLNAQLDRLAHHLDVALLNKAAEALKTRPDQGVVPDSLYRQ